MSFLIDKGYGPNKPPLGASIKQGHPLAQGMICCLLANELGGPLIDLVSGNAVPLIGSGVRGNFQFGHGLNCNGASSGATAVAWSLLKSIGNQATVLFRGQIASGAGNFASLFGVFYSTPAGTPFYCYALDLGALGTTVRINWNSGGSQNNLSGTPTAYDGTERQYVGVIRGSSIANGCEIWENTTKLASSTANAGPNYTATSHIDVGYGLLLDSKVIFRHGYIWNRALRANEIQQLLVEPYGFLTYQKRYFHTVILVPLTQTSADQMNTMADAVSLLNGAAAAYGVILGENLNFLLDSVSLVGGAPDFQLTFGDNLNYLSDSQRMILGMIKTFSDSVNSWADAVARLVGLPVAVFDSNQYNWADVISVQHLAPLSVSKSDTLSLSDAVAVALLNVRLTVTTADTLNLMADAVRIYNTLRVALADNFVLSDALRMRFSHLLRTAETINALSDSVLISLSRRPAFADSMNNLSDAVSVALAVRVSRSASDQLVMSDAVSVRLNTPYPTTDVNRIRRYLNDTE